MLKRVSVSLFRKSDYWIRSTVSEMKIRHANSEITRPVINFVESIKILDKVITDFCDAYGDFIRIITRNFFNRRGCWSWIQVLLCIPTRSLVTFLNLFLRICIIRENYWIIRQWVIRHYECSICQRGNNWRRDTPPDRGVASRRYYLFKQRCVYSPHCIIECLES